MTKERSDLEAAEAELKRAAAAVHREQVLDRLSRKPGLSYARLGEDLTGPYLVAWEGQIIGEVRSEEETALKDWYAVTSEVERPSGPFPTIRAAAASLPR